MKKKSALIVTLSGFNFGNRLQNYALQYVLNARNIKTKTLSCSTHSYSLKSKLLNALPAGIAALLCMLQARLRKRHNLKRSSLFYLFDSEIKFTKRINTSYDYFMSGSDQVWNTTFNTDIPLALLAPFNRNKISYAASVGMPSIPEDKAELFQENIDKFDFISVREAGAKSLLEIFTDKTIEIVLDPTLLLSAQEWDQKAKRPKWLTGDDKFILKYFLGEESAVSQNFYEFAENNNFKIIDILDSSSESYATGPSEFIWLIKHAESILTDSYHAVIFSIIYHKAFKLVSNDAGRVGMLDRFATLASKLGLDLSKISSCSESYMPDYDSLDVLLSKERESSFGFLDKALNND